MKQKREDANYDLSEEESNGFRKCVELLMSQVKNTSATKQDFRASKSGPQLFVMESLMAFNELTEAGSLPPPVYPVVKKVRHSNVLTSNEEGITSAAAKEATADVDADANAWPKEISDTWQFYCTCGKCKGPHDRLQVMVCMVVDGGKFQMPIKVFATSMNYLNVGEYWTLKFDLSNEHLEACTKNGSLVAYDSQYKFKLIPHMLNLYRPISFDTYYQDQNTMNGWKLPFTEVHGDRKFVHAWTPYEDWPKNEQWPIELEALLVGRCDSRRGRHINEPRTSPLEPIRSLLGVIAYVFSK